MASASLCSSRLFRLFILC
ncbi:Protein of unknown function [Pyronema omphalodes CBS 100304]|uniref:Uncharacterized protein n=1 Tax=Pyronema omphalodes (strain CBS 100304) TaxID=1076935 RepID=U4LEF9_PYROM|nr:Protein of unknown function [Pyronema omphalodes CBS 100304]